VALIETEHTHDGRVLRAWLNRPEVHNAFGAELIQDIHDLFEAADADDHLRVVVLGGRGRSFSAGADAAWMRAALDLDWDGDVADAERLAAMLRRVDECAHPVIARVHGAALGGGAGLVACADVAVAAASTTLGFVETRVGLIPATIAPFVVAKIGLSEARARFLTGSRFDAREAYRIGLVHDVAEDGKGLDEAVEAWIAQLLLGGPEAQRHAKMLLRNVVGRFPDRVHRETAEAIAERRRSHEGQEGLRALLEKRPPSWQ
jgi:methylglutaconyl-CoA hydratase